MRHHAHLVILTKVLFSITLCLVGLLGINFPAAKASGSGRISLRVLTDNSDAIVVGEILDGSLSSERLALTVDVDRVLKGSIQAGTVITIDSLTTPQRPANTRSPEKDLGLFFLKSSAAGKWALIPPVSGFLLDVRGAYVPLPRNISPQKLPSSGQTTPLDNVVAELVSTLQGPISPGQVSFDLAAEYRSNRTPNMKALFSSLRANQNNKLRALGLQTALIDGDESALGALEHEVKTLSPNLAAALMEDLKYSFTNPSPPVIAKLGQLSLPANDNRDLRLAAIVALTRAHTRDTLPYLAPLLHDKDSLFRALGVGGLAQFANGVSVGGHEPASGHWKYRNDETVRNSAMDEQVLQKNPAILAFWKSWWSEHRAELVAPH